MTAEEYFYNHWQKANRSKFGDYGDYNSDEYAIAFANDYAALRIHDVVGLKLKDNSNDRKWVCQKCGELVDGRNVTFEEYHEGCGGRCV